MSKNMAMSAEVDGRKTTRIYMARAPVGHYRTLALVRILRKLTPFKMKSHRPVTFMTGDGTTKYRTKDAGQHEDRGDNGHLLAQFLTWDGDLKGDYHHQ
jgi:hypothetical protein